MNAAVTEFERALALPGVIGAQLPGNYFLTRKDAETARPLLEEVAPRTATGAVLFIHHGPRPGDAFPKVANDTDNARRRNGTLDMQASLLLDDGDAVPDRPARRLSGRDCRRA